MASFRYTVLCGHNGAAYPTNPQITPVRFFIELTPGAYIVSNLAIYSLNLWS